MGKVARAGLYECVASNTAAMVIGPMIKPSCQIAKEVPNILA